MGMRKQLAQPPVVVERVSAAAQPRRQTPVKRTTSDRFRCRRTRESARISDPHRRRRVVPRHRSRGGCPRAVVHRGTAIWARVLRFGALVSFIASVRALGDRLPGSVPPMEGRGVAKGDQIKLLR